MADQQMKHFSIRHYVRFLKLLARFPKSGIAFSTSEDRYLLEPGAKAYSFDTSICDSALKAGHAMTQQKRMTITDAGLLRLKRELHPDQTQGLAARNHVSEIAEIDGQQVSVTRNLDESPLIRLYKRTTRDGKSYLADDEFQAGERLRRDFECAQLQPKISANWTSTTGSSASSNVSSDISDFALDARNRVNAAMDRLGPELAGVVIDICCFLKGIELVERERKWPPRSAKLMLKTALSMLGRHYGLSGAGSRENGSIRSWGASGFKPQLQR